MQSRAPDHVQLRKMLGMDIVLVIAGNKIDLEKNRSVNKADAER